MRNCLQVQQFHKISICKLQYCSNNNLLILFFFIDHFNYNISSYNSKASNRLSSKNLYKIFLEVGITYKKSEQLTAWTNLVRECLMQKRLITIFSMDNNNSVADLDKAILQAILQGKTDNTNKLLYVSNQLIGRKCRFIYIVIKRLFFIC